MYKDKFNIRSWNVFRQREDAQKYVHRAIDDAPRRASVVGDVSALHAPAMRALSQCSDLVIAAVFLRKFGTWVESYTRHLPKATRFETILCRSYGIPTGLSRHARLEKLHEQIVDDARRLKEDFPTRVVIVWLESHDVGCRRLMRKVGLRAAAFVPSLGRCTTMLQSSAYQQAASCASSSVRG